MNSDISLRYRQFFDLEAEVDDLDEDSEGQQGAEDDDDFLDDNTSATHSGGVHLHPVATGDEETEDVDQYVKELTERARKRRCIEHTEGNHDEDSHNTNKTSYKTSLWRVRCKRGSQDHLVNVLTRRQHVCGETISHIFALPRIRNWVYLVVQSLHTSIYTLLISCSSVITSGGRAIFQEVPLDEQADTLKMLQSKSLEEGDWIVVKTGPYHGDVGYVLVVPWFVDLEFIHVSKKTQRHTKHNLLGPGGNPYVFGMNTHCLAITKPRFNEKARVDKGLLVLECRHNAVLPATTISLRILDLFHQSLHPLILAAQTKAPCPREWLFEEEEEVEVLSQSGSHDCRQGKIVVVASHHVEVLLDAGKGLHRFPFYQVVKLFCIGDYVRGIDGLKEGFIQSCSDFHVVLLTMGDNGDFEDFSCGKNTVHKLNRVQNENSNAADNDTWTGIRVIVRKCNHHLDGRRATVTSMAQTMFRLRAVVTLHENSITNYTLDPDHLVDERTGQSLLYTVKSRSVSELKGSGKTPWIGTRVVIHGKSGPLHTKIGIVRDVICGQSNKSGLCVVLILDNYDPSLTNKEYTVDYEHVLEVTTLRPLRLFQPLKDSQSAFLPKPQFIRSGREEAIASAAATQRGTIQLERPESPAEHLDPAWDPRSPAPAGLLPTPDLPNSSAFEHHDHWVTDIRLLTYRLRVQASGKPMTMTTEYNALSEKVEAYIHKGKKKKKVLESYQFVQPMEPSTPRHYDRWIVIKGDHAGKQVRSIRYDKGLNPKMPIWWTVAVVLPSDDDVDTVTGEELCIESTCLCLEDESAESKKRNMQLSRGLREEAPKSSHQQPQCPSTFSSFAAH
ncbi:hypothetical protein IW261DRAFT_1567205 [Armillaria novae-zelandiae]|uniref:Chromatin elongation factor spt5 n=1 Tax=Armillaria novae-zelandiae TaxID=153914 RepID=A0AA39NNI1_9AGAR|nr:hypothetical protein IW261DRAFT_1573418 [Armillaria novae-zelandiae]KAK0476508.1 hypothetical protein IW261DRAFT_1567205 [Armillaria novae-zelandiae]